MTTLATPSFLGQVARFRAPAARAGARSTAFAWLLLLGVAIPGAIWDFTAGLPSPGESAAAGVRPLVGSTSASASAGPITSAWRFVAGCLAPFVEGSAGTWADLGKYLGHPFEPDSLTLAGRWLSVAAITSLGFAGLVRAGGSEIAARRTALLAVTPAIWVGMRSADPAIIVAVFGIAAGAVLAERLANPLPGLLAPFLLLMLEPLGTLLSDPRAMTSAWSASSSGPSGTDRVAALAVILGAAPAVIIPGLLGEGSWRSAARRAGIGFLATAPLAWLAPETARGLALTLAWWFAQPGERSEVDGSGIQRDVSRSLLAAPLLAIAWGLWRVASVWPFMERVEILILTAVALIPTLIHARRRRSSGLALAAIILLGAIVARTWVGAVDPLEGLARLRTGG